MRIFSMLVVLFLTSSCEKNDIKEINKRVDYKYEFNSIQSQENGTLVFVLDKKSGELFIRTQDGSWIKGGSPKNAK